MLKIEFQGQFKKDYKTMRKRGHSPDRLTEIIQSLAEERPLPVRCLDHQLTTSKHYKGMIECHIEPDWLLIYQIIQERLTLRLIRTGTHSDLFQ